MDVINHKAARVLKVGKCCKPAQTCGQHVAKTII
jgi:hypothetical protein